MSAALEPRNQSSLCTPVREPDRWSRIVAFRRNFQSGHNTEDTALPRKWCGTFGIPKVLAELSFARQPRYHPGGHSHMQHKIFQGPDLAFRNPHTARPHQEHMKRSLASSRGMLDTSSVRARRSRSVLRRSDKPKVFSRTHKLMLGGSHHKLHKTSRSYQCHFRGLSAKKCIVKLSLLSGIASLVVARGFGALSPSRSKVALQQQGDKPLAIRKLLPFSPAPQLRLMLSGTSPEMLLLERHSSSHTSRRKWRRLHRQSTMTRLSRRSAHKTRQGLLCSRIHNLGNLFLWLL